MGKWLVQLRDSAREKAQGGSAKSAKSPFCHFWHPAMGAILEESARDTTNPAAPELVAGIRNMARPGQWAELANTIHWAVTWVDLEGVLDSAQRAYEGGELLREQVEALAIEAAARARHLPEHPVEFDSPTQMIPSEQLLPPEERDDTCPNCGRDAWWIKSGGERMCGICHPDPRRSEKGGSL